MKPHRSMQVLTRTLTLGRYVANLDGTVTDDGLPKSGTLTTLWTQLSGTGTVSFGNASVVDTTASFSTSGVYVLELKADDGGLTTTDTVTITSMRRLWSMRATTRILTLG